MQERLEDWGAGLSDAEFACALAALGVLRSVQPTWTAAEMAAKIRDLARKGPLAWRLPFQSPPLDSSVFAQAWRLFLESGGSAVRITISFSGLLDRSWIERQLSHPEVGAASVESVELEEVSRGGYRDLNPDSGRRYSYPTRPYKVFDDDIVERDGLGYLPLHKAALVVNADRFLQAQLYDLTDPLKPKLTLRELRPGVSCIASVRIGSPDQLWISVDLPFPTPKEPPESKGHRLTVIFEEPRVSTVPQVRTLWLPRAGSSEPVHFPFKAPEDGSITARITVLHANRVLQTGRLYAPIGDGHWTFKLDAMPRTRLFGLNHRSRFDAALIVDRDRSMTAASESEAVVLPVDEAGLRALTAFLGSQISDISNDPERYEGLESAGSRELLRKLAGMGAQVHRQLCQGTGFARLADARRIQITSAHHGSFLPIELIYRFTPPSREAQICPHALSALEAGDCASACPSDKREIICPLGFWGLSRVIERHGPEPDNQEGHFKIRRAEPYKSRMPLFLSGSALLAASDKVSMVKKDAVTELFRKLKERGPVALAKSWKEWEHHVKADLPHLLVLLPHHQRKGGLEILEIGADDFLESIEIHSGQVRKEPDGPHPIVLLMGCETHLAEISFESFATLFRSWGASVVVSTIATILGRHASPATAILVELLDQMAAEERTFGDVMLRLRQKLVARATPMALGLTSYGDADWILTRKEA